MRCFVVLLFLLCSTRSSGTRILQGYCSGSTEKCGFLNFGFVMHQGKSGTSECVEICAFVPLVRFGFECGSCSSTPSTPSSQATPSPTEQQISTPAPTPIEVCSTDRCVFGLGFAMHRGSQDSASCVEICTFNPVLRQDFACGYCNSEGSLPPTPNPTTLSPTRSPTGSPTTAPTTSAEPSMMPTITSMPVDSSGFNIELDLSQVGDEDKILFANGVDRWQSVIVGELPDVERSEIDQAAPDGCEYPRLVDDLFICAFLGPLDGPGNVAGFARPLFIRGTDADPGLPVTGEILFDTEDMAAVRRSGLLQSLITHELGHVLGFGLLWESRGQAGPTSQSCPYFGPLATAEFNAISGCTGTTTPIELVDTDVGTRCLHWAENCMENELMTGELELDDMPLSRITVASFADIGYEVTYDNVDPFGTGDLNPNCVCRRRRLADGEAIMLSHDEISARTGPRRRLSEELRQEAIKFGLSVLEASATQYAADGATTEGVPRTTTFVGDRALSVLVRDGDSFFGVLVTREMGNFS